MAAKAKYIAAHPNNEDTITVLKGGKVPTFATWAMYEDGWRHIGYSFQATKADAAKKAAPELRKYGMRVTATRILPAG
jgi:hypothetical protein